MNRPRYQHRMRAYRRREGRWIFGVCGGLADFFELPAWAIRAMFVVVASCSAGAVFAVYIILAMVMKPAPYRPFRGFAEEEFYASYQSSRPETLARAEKAFRGLEKRLQHLESIVTRPGFEHEDELRRL